LKTQLTKLSEIELLALLSAASVLRKEKSFNLILSFMIDKKISVKKIYEALLQTYLFAGFPSALISLKKFSEIANKELQYSGFDLSSYQIRGEINCRIIYGKKYDKLIENISSFSPEMAEWLVIEGYGKVLGRKGLSLMEREVCNVSILSAMKFADQLYSHINGAFRVKTDMKLLKQIVKNLDIISSKTASKFGNKILEQFITNKSKKSFNKG